MDKTLQENIRRAISTSKEDGSKRQISILLSENTINQMDAVLDLFKKVTDSKFATSRNQLIEVAIEEFIKAAADVLLEDHHINLQEFLYTAEDKEEEDEDKVKDKKGIIRDLVICPATDDNFNKIYLGQNVWYSVRINKKNIANIKYASCYVGSPVSGITHYAKVDRIDPYPDGKYIIYFDGAPIQLKNKVRIGNSAINDVRKLRYSTLEQLLSATVVSDLW